MSSQSPDRVESDKHSINKAHTSPSEKLDVCVLGYQAIHGIEDMRDYLLKHTGTLGIIGLSPPYSKNIRPYIHFYENGKQVLKKTIPSKPTSTGWFWVIHYLLDIFTIFFTSLRMKRRFDLIISVTYAPTIAGILLKKIGLTKAVIYYCYDFIRPNANSPLQKRLMAATFLFIDRFCVRWTDQTWNLNEAIGMIRKRTSSSQHREHLNQITVPPPLFPKPQITSKSPSNIAVYMGYLRSNQGVDLLIESAGIILKQLPDFKLLIIGSGPEEANLKELVSEMDLNDKVVFLGYVKEGNYLNNIMQSAALGVAIYALPSESGLTWYIAPGKVKTYLEYYIPVVTNVNPIMLGKLRTSGAILCVPSEKEALSRVIVELLTNKQQLSQMQTAVKTVVSEYSADRIYNDAFTSLINAY